MAGMMRSGKPLSEESTAWMTAQLDSFNAWDWNAAGLGRALYIVAAAVFFAIVFFEQYSKREQRLAKLPPGPFQWPYLGCLPHLLLTAGVRSSSRLRQKVAALATKHGPIMLLQLVDTQILVVSSGEFAKEVLVTHDPEFYYRPKSALSHHLFFNAKSISFAEGRHHFHLRHLCDTCLFSSTSLPSSIPHRKHAASQLLHSIFSSSQKSQDICIRNEITTFVRNSICGMLLGTAHLDVENISMKFTRETLGALLDETVGVIGGGVTLAELTPGLRWLRRERELKGLRARLEEYFRVVMDDRVVRLETKKTKKGDEREEEEAEVMLDVLLGLEGDKKLSNEAIMGVLLDTLVGGIYPISATIEWALTELIRNPALLEKVQMEMTDVVGPYHIIEEAEFSQLPVFQAIVKETLRLHPSVPLSLPHTNKEKPIALAQYEIPAHTHVIIDYAAVGRDAKVWRNPLQFDPARFTDTDAASQIDSFKLLPFGYGRRRCPGANVGVILVQLGLTCLVQGFDWGLLEGQVALDIDVEEAPGAVCFRAKPLVLRAAPRLADQLYAI